MYTTFVGFSSDQQKSSTTGTATSSTAARPNKAKRHQVSRACDPCRTSRAKCSQVRPCKTCTERRITCTDSSAPGLSSPSIAEVHELRAKIQQLESRLPTTVEPTPPGSAHAQETSNSGSARSTRSSTRHSPSNSNGHVMVSPQTSPWPHMPVPMAGSRPKLTTIKAKPSEHAAKSVSPRSRPRRITDGTPARQAFSRNLSLHMSPFAAIVPRHSDKSHEEPTDQRLSKSTQLYHLGNFWHHVHCILPVLCERETTAHFEALWPSAPGTSSIAQVRRRPSPLIDIILACAMQYTSASRSPGTPDQGNGEIQRSYFESSQGVLINDSIDTPKPMTVQTLILLSHYLSREGKVQKAASYSSMALRMAATLGLHREPPSNLNVSTQELRRRIWWAVYTAEAVNAVAYGHHWILNNSVPSVKMLTDDAVTMAATCARVAKDESTGVTWLSHSVQMASLYRIAVAGLSKDGNAEDGGRDQTIAELEQWAKQVPSSLRTTGTFGRRRSEVADDDEEARRRREEEEMEEEEEGEEGETQHTFDETPFVDSPGTYRLTIDTSKPLWLQKQRLILELHFRHTIMLVCRPSIEEQLGTSGTSDKPEPTATKCLNHALSISRILLQVLTETPLLDSQSEALHMLWNASLTLMAFPVVFGAQEDLHRIIETLRVNSEVFACFAAHTGAAGAANSQLQQLLQQMGFPSVMNNPAQQLSSTFAEAHRSSMATTMPNPLVLDGFPIQQDSGPQPVSTTAFNPAGTAHWPAQYSHPPSLDGGSSIGIPSTVGSWASWQPYTPSSASSAAVFSRNNSSLPWASKGTEDVHMDDLMIDWTNIQTSSQ